MAVQPTVTVTTKDVAIPEKALERLRAMVAEHQQAVARLDAVEVTRLTDVATAMGLDPAHCQADLKAGVFRVAAVAEKGED